jgi:hypothetical protein
MTSKLTRVKHKILYCITHSSDSKAATILGGLKFCPMEILQGLATLATDSTGFGNTALWTPAQVCKELP